MKEARALYVILMTLLLSNLMIYKGSWKQEEWLGACDRIQVQNRVNCIEEKDGVYERTISEAK